MFWYRQLRLEARRAGVWAALLLLLIGFRVVTVTAFPSPWALWRLAWLMLVAEVILAEPFDRRAFWRTRPIPRGGLIAGKGIFLLVTCWLPPVVAHVFLLWRQGPPAGALPWLTAETALWEGLYLLLAVAVALAVRNRAQALGAMCLLWLGPLLIHDFAGDRLAPPASRDALAESGLIVLAVAIPALLTLIVVQITSRAPRRSFRGLLVTAGLCLAATFWLRASLPWRLDPAPLHPAPWTELDSLRLHRVDSTGELPRPHLQRWFGEYRLLVPLGLDRPLPRGHGLQIRRIRSTLELPSGKTIRSVIAKGEWFCRGRREIWREAGLTFPGEVSCEPGTAVVPVARVEPAERQPLLHRGGRLEAEIQLDLFRGRLARKPIRPEGDPGAAGCNFREAKRRRKTEPFDWEIHWRIFPNLFRRHYLPASPRRYLPPAHRHHLLLPTGSDEPEPRVFEIPEPGASLWPPTVLVSPAPLPQDEFRKIRRRFDGEIPNPLAPTLPEGTVLLCEERILVDRTTVHLRLEELSVAPE